MSEIRPIIETYYDAYANWGGGKGAWRARLLDAHGIHSCGSTQEEAAQFCHRTAISHRDMDKYAHLPIEFSEYAIQHSKDAETYADARGLASGLWLT